MAAPPPKPQPREFDTISERGYEELLADPLRDAFTENSDFFHQEKVRQMDPWLHATATNLHLDIGCGQGELLSLMRQQHRGSFYGAEISSGMLKSQQLKGAVLYGPNLLPFADNTFSSLSVACVFHHVIPAERPALIREMQRILRPGGSAFVFEHNPYNPMTQWIVSRTPVDRDAQLLSAQKLKALAKGTFSSCLTRYYLFFPEAIAANFTWAKPLLGQLPLGGQYCVQLRK
jgi:ubiquinone/menaquinone biosynthesis C-methylase UbiE